MTLEESVGEFYGCEQNYYNYVSTCSDALKFSLFIYFILGAVVFQMLKPK